VRREKREKTSSGRWVYNIQNSEEGRNLLVVMGYSKRVESL
jgi:hypothetical protein